MAELLLRSASGLGGADVWIDVDVPVERYAGVVRAAAGLGARVRWFAADPGVERGLLARGVRPERVTLAPAWCTPPAERFALRHRLRRRLRLEPEQFVAAVLPPVTRAGGAFEAVWGAMLAEKVEPRLRVVVPDGSREAHRVLRLAEACRHEFFVRRAARLPLARLLAIADVGLLPARSAVSQTGLLTAAAAGLPLVASRPADAFGLLEANEMLREVRPAGIARALLSLLRDRAGMLAAGRRLRRRFGQIVAAVG